VICTTAGREGPLRTSPGLGVESQVLIALPRGPRRSGAVERLIEEACAAVAEQLPVRCRRTHEVADSAGAPEAVLDAVRGASLLIADLGGHDPAVVLALGFGEALEKEIVVLENAAEPSPLALRDWRRIRYSEHDLANARVRLLRTVRAALDGSDF
jgi:hypothetical protein